MLEYTYHVCKSSWCINIKILAKIIDMSLQQDVNCHKVCNKVWFRFAEEPVIKGELFCQEDTIYLVKGLKLVGSKIIEKSIFDNTLIEVCSLQFSICYFQEDALIPAMMSWAAFAFDFEIPQIYVDFDKKNNKYIFDFNNFNLQN